MYQPVGVDRTGGVRGLMANVQEIKLGQNVNDLYFYRDFIMFCLHKNITCAHRTQRVTKYEFFNTSKTIRKPTN